MSDKSLKTNNHRFLWSVVVCYEKIKQEKIIREIELLELLIDVCSNLSAVTVSRIGDIYLTSYNTNIEGKLKNNG